jgi:hypothetical protein
MVQTTNETTPAALGVTGSFITPKRYSFVIGLDANGQVIENLQDGSSGCYAEIAKVVEHNGMLYFGSIGESAVGRLALPQPSSNR